MPLRWHVEITNSGESMNLKKLAPVRAIPNSTQIGPRTIYSLPLVTAVSILLMLLVTPSALMAQASHTTKLSAMDVTLSLDKTNIVVGEPVQLKVEIVNTSDVPLFEVRANFQLPVGNSVEVHVQPENELEYRYIGAVETGTYGNVVMQLVKGHPEVATVLLLFDREQPSGLLFSKPGTYVLRAKFRFHLGKNSEYLEATLPPTNITVSAPTGDNAKALEMLGKAALVQCMHLSAAPTTAILEMMSKGASQYPDTYLGALAMRAEGMHYSNQADNESHEKAAHLLTQYLRNDVAIVEGDGVAWSIAAAWHTIGKYELARQWIFWLVRHYEHSPRIQNSDPLIWYYYLNPINFTMENPWFVLKDPWSVPGEKPPASLQPRITR